MSFCRFSDMDFSCDVYCYESVYGGFIIHVAAVRVVGDVPKAQHYFNEGNIEEFMSAHKKQMKFLETAERQPIGLEYDGETIQTDSAGECGDALLSLKEMGYNVPQYAIDVLYEEAAA
ncbi:MAG: hypothetical protein HUJ30_02350 [Gammaproteobacteria bacterium]|nr:hypothetical protein [Gammaproteobacteria bacterium]